MENSTPCKIVTPKNFILKLGTRDYVDYVIIIIMRRDIKCQFKIDSSHVNYKKNIILLFLGTHIQFA